MSLKRIILGLVVCLVIIFFTSTTTNQPTTTNQVKTSNQVSLKPIGKLTLVKYVKTIDGDTIVVQTSAKKSTHVRLFGINTAELSSGKSIAFQASQFTASTLESASQVYLELDPVALKDKYNRTLAWVWYKRDGVLYLLNLELLKHRLAEIYWKNESRRYRKELMKYKHNTIN